ncbi:hypothetical protein [Cysteiniphilum litorale]|uniref:hypothetical protein n=1 Tax=Cysteiniphilum litorale TaxID=2056700 RepID=UPI003F8806E4
MKMSQEILLEDCQPTQLDHEKELSNSFTKAIQKTEQLSAAINDDIPKWHFCIFAPIVNNDSHAA